MLSFKIAIFIFHLISTVNIQTKQKPTQSCSPNRWSDFHEFLDRYEEILKTRGLREKTLKDYKQRIGVIRKGFLDTPIQNITTKNIADFLHPFIHEGKTATAKLLRASLIDYFKEA
ncbi:MAG: site-specific integrase [Candidatus Arsenophonus phytopathogenicus]